MGGGLFRDVKHLADADGDDGHDGEGAEGPGEHRRFILLRREDDGDEERLVSNLAEEDQQERLEEAVEEAARGLDRLGGVGDGGDGRGEGVGGDGEAREREDARGGGHRRLGRTRSHRIGAFRIIIVLGLIRAKASRGDPLARGGSDDLGEENLPGGGRGLGRRDVEGIEGGRAGGRGAADGRRDAALRGRSRSRPDREWATHRAGGEGHHALFRSPRKSPRGMCDTDEVNAPELGNLRRTRPLSRGATGSEARRASHPMMLYPKAKEISPRSRSFMSRLK